MANARSGMAVAAECLEKFIELKRKKTYRYIIFRIDRDQIILDKTGSPEETYDQFTASLPEDDCRYSVYDHDFTTADNCNKSKIFFIAWSPDQAKVKAKMVYASSKDTFRQQLDGVQIELQATDAAELDKSVIMERAMSVAALV